MSLLGTVSEILIESVSGGHTQQLIKDIKSVAAKSILINISSTLNVGLKPFKIFTFSGGEEHIKLFDPLDTELVNFTKDAKKITILTNADSSASIMQLLLTTNALKKLNNNAKLNLFIPYFPYARQDRVMIPGEPFSLKLMTTLINSMKYNKVYVLNPHSEVTVALLDNLEQIDNTEFVGYALDDIYNKLEVCGFDKKDLVFVSPDAGAEKKTYELAKKLEINNVILGTKNRDVRNGKILNTDFIGDVVGKHCVIVDDIIDGGYTFIELAKTLKNKGAKSIYLVVSHGIFSKGIDELKIYIDGIYTTNSIKYFEKFVPYVSYYNLDHICEELK